MRTFIYSVLLIVLILGFLWAKKFYNTYKPSTKTFHIVSDTSHSDVSDTMYVLPNTNLHNQVFKMSIEGKVVGSMSLYVKLFDDTPTEKAPVFLIHISNRPIMDTAATLTDYDKRVMPKIFYYYKTDTDSTIDTTFRMDYYENDDKSRVTIYYNTDKAAKVDLKLKAGIYGFP